MGLQTKTFSLAGASLVAGTFTSITQLLGSTANTNVPEGYSRLVRVSMSCTPQQDSATDGISIFKYAGDGVAVQQVIAGPGWSNQAAGPLGGNNGQPVVMESSTGVFDVLAGNQIDMSVSCTTGETCDIAVSLTYSA
jgi:hypothetical protein